MSTASLAQNEFDWNRGCLAFYYGGAAWGQSGPANNGNVTAQQHWAPLNESALDYAYTQQSYSYDSLNRLSSVSELHGGPSGQSGVDYVQVYSYDRYGNRTINNAATWGTGINNTAFELDPAGNNQLLAPGDSGLPLASRRMQYDPAGNLKHDNYTGAGTRTYDAENRMTSAGIAGVPPATYVYDGDGRRIKRIMNGTETWQIYGIGGELLAEYAANSAASNPQKEYGYRNGELLITATMTSGWGSAPTLTDNPLLVNQTLVKAQHITELRSAINSVRSHMSLSAYSWQYSATTSDYINANPILEMRTALDQALGAGSYASGLSQGQPVKAIHIQELRDRILTAWQSGGGVDIRWLVTDHLGTPRMIFDQTGSLQNVSRHDYLPFGEELFAGTGGRTTAQGYGVGDGIRQHFISKERDTETGLDYFGARYFSSTQGRFTGVDPIGATKYHLLDPQLWNAYSYGLNNPLTIIDIDGRFPWTIHLRSFIFRSMVGVSGYGFRGDSRGPSTDERATARIKMEFTLDYDQSRISRQSVSSDPTTLVVPGGEISRTADPRYQLSPVQTAENGKSVEASYAGNNPLVPGSPDINVGASLTLTENVAKGTLSITGQITGDKFPSTEAFVSDQSGNRVFLGAKHEEGDSLASKGRNLNDKTQLFKVDMKIRFDKKGNFTAVIYGGKTYSIKAWNKKVEQEF